MAGRRSSRAPYDLIPLELDWDTECPIPESVTTYLEAADQRLQAYWDQWHRKPIEQYVACDFRDVWRALSAIHVSGILQGRLFCEWGCGFGIVTGLASLLGWEAIGIEAEEFLVNEGREFLRKQRLPNHLWLGNFLPPGAERFAAPQSHHASLFHHIPDAYASHDLGVDDFAIIFAYPWPGEDYFLKEVFREYAAKDAVLLLFLGPYELEVYQKRVRES